MSGASEHDDLEAEDEYRFYIGASLLLGGAVIGTLVYGGWRGWSMTWTTLVGGSAWFAFSVAKRHMWHVLVAPHLEADAPTSSRGTGRTRRWGTPPRILAVLMVVTIMWAVAVFWYGIGAIAVWLLR